MRVRISGASRSSPQAHRPKRPMNQTGQAARSSPYSGSRVGAGSTVASPIHPFLKVSPLSPSLSTKGRIADYFPPRVNLCSELVCPKQTGGVAPASIPRTKPPERTTWSTSVAASPPFSCPAHRGFMVHRDERLVLLDRSKSVLHLPGALAGGAGITITSPGASTSVPGALSLSLKVSTAGLPPRALLKRNSY